MDPGGNIFREKSLQHMASPDRLSDYIKVSNPSVWLALSAVLVLLASAIVWAAFGTLPTTLDVNAWVENGRATSYVDGDTAAKLKPGMAVQAGGAAGTLVSVAERPKSPAGLMENYQDDYLVAMLKAGDWNFAVESALAGAPDGLQKLSITLESVTPLSFLTD